jgi:hypothetical protein
VIAGAHVPEINRSMATASVGCFAASGSPADERVDDLLLPYGCLAAFHVESCQLHKGETIQAAGRVRRMVTPPVVAAGRCMARQAREVSRM